MTECLAVPKDNQFFQEPPTIMKFGHNSWWKLFWKFTAINGSKLTVNMTAKSVTDQLFTLSLVWFRKRFQLHLKSKLKNSSKSISQMIIISKRSHSWLLIVKMSSDQNSHHKLTKILEILFKMVENQVSQVNLEVQRNQLLPQDLAVMRVTHSLKYLIHLQRWCSISLKKLLLSPFQLPLEENQHSEPKKRAWPISFQGSDTPLWTYFKTNSLTCQRSLNLKFLSKLLKRT